MAVDVKQAYRQLLEEGFGKGRLDVFDEICDRGLRAHDPVAGDVDLRQAKQNCAMYRSAFPGLRCTILAQYVDGDTVATRWRMTGIHDGTLMGVQPTGAECTVEGISVGRFQGGKLVEDWVQWDAFGLMRQLGVKMTAASPEEEARPQL
jgi:predicted ester cyclase